MSVVSDGSGDWTLSGVEADISGLNEGVISVDATATDAAGNSASAVTEAVTHSSVPPVVPTVTALTTNDVTPVVAGAATLDAGDVLTVQLNAITYAVGDGNLIDNGDGTWSLLVPAGNALAEGNYAVTARVTDSAGNAATDVTTNELTIDTTAPVIPAATETE